MRARRIHASSGVGLPLSAGTNKKAAAKAAPFGSLFAAAIEAPPGFEPGMSDLQSDALATWLRRLNDRKKLWLPFRPPTADGLLKK